MLSVARQLPLVRLIPCASRRAGLRGELSSVEKRAVCRVGELRAGLFRTSYSAKRTASLPSGHGPKASHWPGIFRSSSPGDRTMGTPWLVSPAHSEEKRDGSRSRVPDTEAFPESRTGRDATNGHSPAGLPAGVGRGCSVGRQPQAAPAFPRLEDSPLEK